jgi:hypothetical protein
MAWTRSKLKAVLLDFLERAGWSAGQVFFATLLAGGSSVTAANLPWKYASTLAISAGVASIVLTAVQYAARATDLPFWLDVVVRLAKTFLASLGGSIVAGGVFDITTFDWTTALNVALLATITALGKSLLARGQNATTESPSTLPPTTYADAVSRRTAAGSRQA